MCAFAASPPRRGWLSGCLMCRWQQKGTHHTKANHGCWVYSYIHIYIYMKDMYMKAEGDWCAALQTTLSPRAPLLSGRCFWEIHGWTHACACCCTCALPSVTFSVKETLTFGATRILVGFVRFPRSVASREMVHFCKVHGKTEQ